MLLRSILSPQRWPLYQSCTKWFAGLSLHYKITFGNGCAIVMAMLTILVGYEVGDYYQYQALNREVLVQEHRQVLDNFQISLLLTRTHWQEMLQLTNQPQLFEEEYRDFQQHAQQFRQDWQKLQELNGRPDPLVQNITFIQQTRSLLAQYAAVPTAYVQEVDMTSAASDRPGQPPSHSVVLALLKQVQDTERFKVTLQQLDNLSEAIVPLMQQAQSDLKPVIQAIEDTDRRRLWSSSIGIMLSLFLATCISWWIARSITRPLKQVTVVAALATQESRFDLRIDHQSPDEIGQVASTLNHLIQRVQELLWEQLAAQGELAQYNQQLETMVADRTQALEDKNVALKTTLTELKTTQTQLVQTAKMSSLGQLVAGIAHEFNNPLTFVASNLPHAQTGLQDLLQALQAYQSAYPQPRPELVAQLDELDLDYLLNDMPEMLASMRQGTKRLQAIVQNLRHFSHLDEAEYKTIQLHDGIDSTLLLLQTRLRSTIANQPITVHKHYGELPTLACYASQLNQVLMDLFNNAIDALQAYAPEAPQNWQPQITIQTSASRDTAHGSIQITIADNGLGIQPQDLPHIFDPFFTTKPVGQGMGLGLSLAYQVVSAHGGTLTCRSQPLNGCELTIALPLADG